MAIYNYTQFPIPAKPVNDFAEDESPDYLMGIKNGDAVKVDPDTVGTKNYNDLLNRPAINGHTLTGNQTAADLGLMPETEIDEVPTEDSENLVTSDGVYTAISNVASDVANLSDDVDDISDRLDTAEAGIAGLNDKTEQHSRRLDNLEAVTASLYAEDIDTDEAYQKSIPSGALPWGTVDMIGGKTVAWNQIVDTGSSAVILATGHKFFTSISGVRSIQTGVGSSISVSNGDIVVDLTQLFGSGSEPSDTSDPRIAWIESYAAANPEYNVGELASAKVDNVKSVGKNLAKFAPELNTDAQYFTYTNNTAENIAWSAKSVTSSKFVATFKVHLIQGEQYTTNSNKGKYIYSDRIWGHNVQAVGAAIKFTFEGETGDYILGIYAIDDTGSIEDFSLVHGSTATYTPYFEANYPIPPAVLALPGYGESEVGGAYNSVDFKTKKYHKKGSYVNGTWTADVQDIDLSDILTDDFNVKVEGGGTLTFEQADDVNLPVPNQTTLYTKV